MTILDAFAVLAYLRDEPAVDEVSRLLRRSPVSLTVLGVAEVVDHLVRVAGLDEEEAILDLAELGLLDPEPLTTTMSLAAGRLRARHYHRTRRSVSLADCVAAAVAQLLERPLATGDPHLLELCHDESIGTIVLPDSTGSRWAPA